MSNTGIKIALPGYDARTAPDYDLSFSSNWPMLQVVKTFNHTVTAEEVSTYDPAFGDLNISTVTLTHNLGYYAFADVWVYSEDSNFGGIVAERLNSRSNYTLYFGKNTIKVPLAQGEYEIYLPAGTAIAVKIYSFDFTQPFSYLAILPPTHPSAYDPHVGLKVVREGRNITSKDLRDFTLHSKGCAPQILTVQTPKNATVVTSKSGSQTIETVTYQIPGGIPARLDFLYSTDAKSWEEGTGSSSWNLPAPVETSTALAYYATVFGQYDVQAVGDVTYTLTNTGLLTSDGLYSPVAFSIIVRRDPLLYAAPTVLTL